MLPSVDQVSIEANFALSFSTGEKPRKKLNFEIYNKKINNENWTNRTKILNYKHISNENKM